MKPWNLILLLIVVVVVLAVLAAPHSARLRGGRQPATAGAADGDLCRYQK